MSILSDEISNDPLVRGYAAMSNLEVADDGNLLIRPAEITIETMMKFLILDNTHKTDGSDTQDRSIFQRMKEVVALADTPIASVSNPWGSTSIGNITEIRQIKTHQLFNYFTLWAQGNLKPDLTSANFQIYLTGAHTAGCMSTVQATSLLALGNNLQSRWSELGLTNVREGTVARARS